MKKELIHYFKLYCILDYQTVVAGKPIVTQAKKIISGGADVIQLRFKPASCISRKNKSQPGLEKIINDARRIARLSKKHKVLFIINDRVDIAKAADADGVHLGQDDLPIFCARKLLGKNKIIGISTHSVKEALKAQKQKADYISLGPIFRTPTKPEYRATGLALIKKLRSRLHVPFLAIGGITLNNLDQVLDAGAKRVAVVRAICKSKNMAKTIKQFKSRLN